MRPRTLASTERLKRNRLIFKLMVCLFAACLIFIAMVIGAFWTEKLKIKRVEIKGAGSVSEEEIKNLAFSFLSEKKYGFLPQNRIFYLPDEQRMINEILKKNAKIGKIEIEKDFPGALIINIEERKQIALLCEEKEEEMEECFFIDKIGFAFERAPSFSPGVFLKFFDQRSDEEKIKESRPSMKKIFWLLTFSNNIKKYINIEKIVIKKEDICELYSAKSPYLVLDTKDDQNLIYNRLLTFWEQIIEKQKQNLEYIDLRFGNKIFFKKQ